MSAYDWEEVKRLAADFQRTQFSSSSQKLSERNCVEIITKLNQLKLLDVVFTNDGKTYITPKHLIKEIIDELYIHNGRVQLIDVAKSLNIDFNVISSLANDVVKENNKIKNIFGQLIDRSYIIHLAEEINERLQQHGRINIAELTRTFDLPSDFIHSVIKENYGRITCSIKQDKQDSTMYYTESYLNQNKAIIRGALVAITKPTLISTVINHCGIEKNIFYFMIDNLIESKQIPGIITERCGNICTYIPQIYLKTQSEWVINFYNQNGYLEYDALSRVGINDPKTFIAKSLKCAENLQYLRNYVIGRQLTDRIEASIDDAVACHTWINILSILPSAIDTEDAEMILRNALGKNKNLSTVQIFNQTYAVPESFTNKINSEIIKKIVPENVNQAIDSGSYEQHIIESKVNNIISDSNKRELSRKEERKKRANVGKSGGGTQGRETKTKATKKKYGQKSGNKVESDEENFNQPKADNLLEFVSNDEIRNVIKTNESFQDEEFDYTYFVEELVQYIYPLVNKAALNLAQTLYETRITNINNTKRKMNAELQDNIISTYQDLKQYHKGIKEFNDEDCQTLLSKYLLKSTGIQLVNTCFTFINDKNEEICSSESRQKILSCIDNKELRESFSKLQKTLNGSSVDEFTSSVEDVFCALNIMMKKMDKKKEKLFLESHKQALIGKLKETDDPPLVLHLVSLILFQNTTQNMLNASGRFVSNILNLLEKHLPVEMFQVLRRYHSLVMKIFKLHESDEDYRKINDELNEITPSIKQLVLTLP